MPDPLPLTDTMDDSLRAWIAERITSPFNQKTNATKAARALCRVIALLEELEARDAAGHVYVSYSERRLIAALRRALTGDPPVVASTGHGTGQ